MRTPFSVPIWCCMLGVPPVSRRSLLLSGAGSVCAGLMPGHVAAAVAAFPPRDSQYDALLQRFGDSSPRQLSASVSDAIAAGINRADNLIFPAWMEGEWELTSYPLANAAPLGRRFLPSDLARMRLGEFAGTTAPPLRYIVRFTRRPSDGAVVSERADNLRAVQNAAAGFTRVEAVAFDGAGKISVRYSPFGPNGTYFGMSRAEVYLNWRRQSTPSASDEFAFSEATRSVYLAQQRELSTISDAETLCMFERQPDGSIHGRQRVLRFLTPNPNSAEGVLWGEASGRAVATLDYELSLRRAPTRPAPEL